MSIFQFSRSLPGIYHHSLNDVNSKKKQNFRESCKDIPDVKKLIGFKEVRHYHTPKLSGCQEPNADGQFTGPFGNGHF